MSSPVKERLTGALILIVAVIIVVPELFSGRAQQQPAADAPDAQSADAGPPLRSYTMDIGTGPAQGQAALTPEPAPSAPVVPPDAGAAPGDESAPHALPPPVMPAAPAKAVADPPIVAAPVAAPPVAATPVATPSRGWWVQLGSFSSRANADRLGESLRKAGYDVQVSPVTAKGKELFRVRAGPVADREAAVALQGRLGAAGHKGSLVAP